MSLNRVDIDKEQKRLDEMEREVIYARQNISRRTAIANMQDDREKPRNITTRDLVPQDVDERYQDFWREEQAELEIYEARRLAHEAWSSLPFWKRWFTTEPPVARRQHTRSCCGDH